MQDFGLRVSGFEFCIRVIVFESGILSTGFRVQVLGRRVSGLGLRV